MLASATPASGSSSIGDDVGEGPRGRGPPASLRPRRAHNAPRHPCAWRRPPLRAGPQGRCRPTLPAGRRSQGTDHTAGQRAGLRPSDRARNGGQATEISGPASPARGGLGQKGRHPPDPALGPPKEYTHPTTSAESPAPSRGGGGGRAPPARTYQFASLKAGPALGFRAGGRRPGVRVAIPALPRKPGPTPGRARSRRRVRRREAPGATSGGPRTGFGSPGRRGSGRRGGPGGGEPGSRGGGKGRCRCVARARAAPPPPAPTPTKHRPAARKTNLWGFGGV